MVIFLLRARRPDRQVYVPRGRRDKPSSLSAHSTNSLQHSPNSTGSETESPRGLDSSKKDEVTKRTNPSTSAESMRAAVTELIDNVKHIDFTKHKDTSSSKESIQYSPQSSTSVISSADSLGLTSQSSDQSPVSSGESKTIIERVKGANSARPKSAPVQTNRPEGRKLQLLDTPKLVEPCTKSDSEQNVPTMSESDEARALRRAAKVRKIVVIVAEPMGLSS